jgi:hypothetical protein
MNMLDKIKVDWHKTKAVTVFLRWRKWGLIILIGWFVVSGFSVKNMFLVAKKCSYESSNLNVKANFLNKKIVLDSSWLGESQTFKRQEGEQYPNDCWLGFKKYAGRIYAGFTNSMLWQRMSRGEYEIIGGQDYTCYVMSGCIDSVHPGKYLLVKDIDGGVWQLDMSGVFVVEGWSPGLEVEIGGQKRVFSEKEILDD